MFSQREGEAPKRVLANFLGQYLKNDMEYEITN